MKGVQNNIFLFYNMKKLIILILLFTTIFSTNECLGQNLNSDKKYTFKTGDINGIGKWYMGREIAHVMGFQGIAWLERSNREKEENVSNLLLNMNIKPNEFR